MQESTLARLNNTFNRVALDKAWQCFKRNAANSGQTPDVRFSAEFLPAYYHSEMTRVYENTVGEYVLKTSISGLSGNDGVMPRAIYRQVMHTKLDLGDEAPSDFLDTFNNRYFRLYCQVEQKNDLSSQLEEETFFWNQQQLSMTDMLSSLSGCTEEASGLPKERMIQYSGLMGMKLTCPITLKAILEDFFEVRFEVEGYGLEYQPVTPCSLTRLGKKTNSSRLGAGAMLGKMTPMLSQKLNIFIFPLDYQHSENIRSNNKMMLALDDLVKSYMGEDTDYRLHMKINSQLLPRVCLTSDPRSALKVGQSAWMKAQSDVEQAVAMPLSLS
ncbi:type VI secretion system baseplate subunit TssG [Shewanella psychropiezotolerans]|uniref:Type VI secretion system baseplate subunit TssG n=1 Tax=Shewanella psychropiezotolerans TaxID=2593655 RepID=A0ABX5WY45_9GAMM|nr:MULTISPECIES: type VI secretion system baseplate subunit TssG [Shewanella]MPY26917.1 type VI secretion system baseplate subunit TssG [Shewanella sp. YLB-07]QDO83357.1 type VI secretion system baseplate subunit TssG [Shewanella psychropiezotolerans]